MRADLATYITTKILDLMKIHGSNWRVPWTGNGLYRNAVTMKAYRGINQPILATQGFSSAFVATYKQWSELGAQVCKGAKGTQIYFWKPYAIRDRDTEEEKRMMLARTYFVFSEDQVENAPPREIKERPAIERHAECDRIISETGIEIRWGGDKSAYIPARDYIVMPKPEQFDNADALHSTVFHEMGHATGHEKRLNRKLIGRFGDSDYAFEELIAESTAALVCAATGIIPEPRKETAQYLNNWMQGMRDDKQAIVRAFAHAQRAADWILKDTPEIAPSPARPDFSPDQPLATKEM